MRAVNRVLSFLLGLLLLLAGLAAIAWVIATAIGSHYLPGSLAHTYSEVTSAIRFASRLNLGSVTAIVTCIVLIMVGLLLLFFELRPSKPVRLDLPDNDSLRWRVERRSFEQALQWLLESRTSAQRITVRLRRRWRLAITAEGDRMTRSEVESELQGLLQRLGSESVARVRIRVRRSRGVI